MVSDPATAAMFDAGGAGVGLVAGAILESPTAASNIDRNTARGRGDGHRGGR